MLEKELTGLILNNSQIKQCRDHLKEEFFSLWNQGIKFYLQGDWQQAKTYFEQTKNYFQGDKDLPSEAHLQYLEKFNYKAPSDWHGVKKLYSK